MNLEISLNRLVFCAYGQAKIIIIIELLTFSIEFVVFYDIFRIGFKLLVVTSLTIMISNLKALFVISFQLIFFSIVIAHVHSHIYNNNIFSQKKTTTNICINITKTHIFHEYCLMHNKIWTDSEWHIYICIIIISSVSFRAKMWLISDLFEKRQLHKSQIICWYDLFSFIRIYISFSILPFASSNFYSHIRRLILSKRINAPFSY